jgi:hypothetical protein
MLEAGLGANKLTFGNFIAYCYESEIRSVYLTEEDYVLAHMFKNETTHTICHYNRIIKCVYGSVPL